MPPRDAGNAHVRWRYLRRPYLLSPHCAFREPSIPSGYRWMSWWAYRPAAGRYAHQFYTGCSLSSPNLTSSHRRERICCSTERPRRQRHLAKSSTWPHRSFSHVNPNISERTRRNMLPACGSCGCHRGIVSSEQHFPPERSSGKARPWS